MINPLEPQNKKKHTKIKEEAADPRGVPRSELCAATRVILLNLVYVSKVHSDMNVRRLSLLSMIAKYGFYPFLCPQGLLVFS